MNEVRAPLNKSLHEVLGLYANLSAAPIAPVPEANLIHLTEAQYQEIQKHRQTHPRVATRQARAIVHSGAMSSTLSRWKCSSIRPRML